MLLTSGDQLENWRIVDLLGEGGMGSVYRGQSLMLEDVHAAIKVARPTDFQHARERFLREIKALLKLHHPAVVRVQGFGEDQERGLLWFAMDLVEGEPLDEVIERGAMPLDRALPFFVELADGLAHAHERGVAHRDLKPANIIVRSDGSPVLVDFGISAASGETQLTKTGGVVGTPQYLPPEALEGRLDDPMTGDIYALGQVILEAITGRPAFPFDPKLTSTQNALRIMHNKVQVGPLDPGQGIPDDLRGIVLRATHPEPSTRTRSATEVAEQLRAVASGAGIRWGGPTLLPTTGETTAGRTFSTVELGVDAAPRRRRGGLIVGGLAAVLLLALLGIGVVAIAGGAVWWLATRDGGVAGADAPEVAAGLGDAAGDGEGPIASRVAADDQGTTTDEGGDGVVEADLGPSPPSGSPAGTRPVDRGGLPTDAIDPVDDEPLVDDLAVAAAEADAPEPGTDAMSDDAVAEVAVEAPSAPAVRRLRPDWDSVAGIQKGMSDGALERVLGDGAGTSSPHCRTGESAKSYLGNSVIVCRRLVGGARRVQLTRRVLDHRGKLPDDPKLSLLGATAEHVEAAIGAPASRDSSGRWRYEHSRVLVDFAGGTVRSLVIEL